MNDTMVRAFFIFALLLCGISSYGQGSVGITAILDTQRLYREYRDDLDAFEAKHGHFIQTPNTRVHYLTWGSPKGMPLVWTHGTHGNAYDIYNFADSLVLAGYYVVAVDFYGHGLTPIPKKDVSLYHMADDIKMVMDELKIKKAVMGGFSRGGSITTAFYDAYPDRVLGLILEDGGSVAWDVNGHKQPVDSLAAEFRRNHSPQPPRTYSSEYDLFQRAYNRNATKPPAVFRQLIYSLFTALKPDTGGKYCFNPGLTDLVCETNPDMLLAAIHRPLAAPTLFGASTHLLYPKIIYRNLDVPMLILDPTGKESSFDFEEENRRLQQSHPTLITHKIYPNTGHQVKYEHPTEFLADVVGFLKVVKGRKG